MYASSALAHRIVQHGLTGVRPSAATDGVDLAGWKQAGYGPTRATIYIDASQATTIAAPTGGTIGAELWGFALDAWWFLGSLNGGAAIPIAGNTLGSALEVGGLVGYDRLFVAGTPDAGTATVKLAPHEVLS